MTVGVTICLEFARVRKKEFCDDAGVPVLDFLFLNLIQ